VCYKCNTRKDEKTSKMLQIFSDFFCSQIWNVRESSLISGNFLPSSADFFNMDLSGGGLKIAYKIFFKASSSRSA